MAEYLIPWLGIGALVAVGMGISAGKQVDATVQENSRNGPPFYDCAGAQQLRQFGGRQFRKALRDNPPNKDDKQMNSEDAYRASVFIQQQSQKARIRAWEAATNHSHHIIVQPNSRKPTYVQNW